MNYLIGHFPYVLNGERNEVVLLEEIIGTEAEQLKGDADVPVVVEPVQHVNTSAIDKDSNVTHPACRQHLAWGVAAYYLL